MGCGSSSEAKTPGSGSSGKTNDDKAFIEEATEKRMKLDKKKGFAVMAGEDGVADYEEGEEEDPLFVEQDETSQEFMAVRPWIG